MRGKTEGTASGIRRFCRKPVAAAAGTLGRVGWRGTGLFLAPAEL